VVALESGRLVLQGVVSGLMTPQALARIYGLPMSVAVQDGHAYALPE